MRGSCNVRAGVLSLYLWLGACSEDAGGVSGPGGTGGTSGSGGTAGTSSAGSAGLGGSGGETCSDAPVTETHGGILVDQGIAPVAGVKHDIAIEYAAALGGFAVSHVLATSDKTGLALELRAVRPEASSLVADPPIRVTDDTAPSASNAGWPSIAANADGTRLLVVWGDDRLGSGIGPIEILGQLFDVTPAGFVKRGTNFVVSTQPSTDEWRPRAVFAAGANRFWVAWADDREFAAQPGGRHVWARSVGLDASLGPELELGDGLPWQDGVHAASDGERVLFVWSHADESGATVMLRHLARFVDGATGALSELQIVLERPSITLAPPAVARDSRRCRYLVAWQESDNREIWGTLLGDDGATIRPRFPITTNATGSGSPHLAYSATTGTYLLSYGTWQDAQAYVIELDGQGDPIGAARSLHASPPQNGTYFQDVSAGGAHALAISNEDYNRIEGALLTAAAAP